MSAIINNYRQLDVAFLLLNDLTTKLRTAGARISVRKVGNFHRITVLKEPTVTTIEQILGDTSGETETPHLNSNDAITSPTVITSSPDDAVSETGSNTTPTINTEIENNSVVDAIALPESPESISSTEDTPSEDAANTVPTVNEEIEDNSVKDAIALPESPESISSPNDTPSEDAANTVPTLNEEIEDNSVVDAIAPPTSSEPTSPLDESHTGDSKDIISENTAEIITNSTDSPTPDNSSSEITNIPGSPELASLEDLQTLTLKRLRELAKLHQVPGFSRMKEEKLVTKLHGLATKEQIM